MRDEGLQRSPDREIFKKAIAEERVILTFDLDFGEIAALSEGEKCAVVIFRLRDATATHVIARLDPVLTASSSHLMEGSVVVVEETRRRIRSLPIGED